MKHHIAIFASGAGSNARKIIEHFINDSLAEVALIVCNNPTAGVIAIAAEHHIPTLLIDKERFLKGDAYLPEMEKAQINFIVLAGFLWKVPVKMVRAYEQRIVNIHPALLPKYGGKGMYGAKVHSAVLDAKEAESGITIHYVNEYYDEGSIIFQYKCRLAEDETPESLAEKVHGLEHEFYPYVIAGCLQKLA